MAGPSNADIYQKLGGLLANMEALRDDFHRADQQSHEHRETVYKRFEELSLSTASVEQRVALLEPVVQTFTNFRLKASGAIFVLTMIGAAMGAIITFFADAIKTWLLHLFPH